MVQDAIKYCKRPIFRAFADSGAAQGKVVGGVLDFISY